MSFKTYKGGSFGKDVTDGTDLDTVFAEDFSYLGRSTEDDETTVNVYGEIYASDIHVKNLYVDRLTVSDAFSTQIVTSDIADGAITSDKISSDIMSLIISTEVDTSLIADGAITTSKIEAGAVTSDKLHSTLYYRYAVSDNYARMSDLSQVESSDVASNTSDIAAIITSDTNYRNNVILNSNGSVEINDQLTVDQLNIEYSSQIPLSFDNITSDNITSTDNIRIGDNSTTGRPETSIESDTSVIFLDFSGTSGGQVIYLTPDANYNTGNVHFLIRNNCTAFAIFVYVYDTTSSSNQLFSGTITVGNERIFTVNADSSSTFGADYSLSSEVTIGDSLLSQYLTGGPTGTHYYDELSSGDLLGLTSSITTSNHSLTASDFIASDLTIVVDNITTNSLTVGGQNISSDISELNALESLIHSNVSDIAALTTSDSYLLTQINSNASDIEAITTSDANYRSYIELNSISGDTTTYDQFLITPTSTPYSATSFDFYITSAANNKYINTIGVLIDNNNNETTAEIFRGSDSLGVLGTVAANSGLDTHTFNDNPIIVQQSDHIHISSGSNILYNSDTHPSVHSDTISDVVTGTYLTLITSVVIQDLDENNVNIYGDLYASDIICDTLTVGGENITTELNNLVATDTHLLSLINSNISDITALTATDTHLLTLINSNVSDIAALITTDTHLLTLINSNVSDIASLTSDLSTNTGSTEYVQASDGTASLPTISFVSDTSLGLYRSSDMVLGISCSDLLVSGRMLVHFSSDNTGATYTLDVNGEIGASGDITSFYSDERLKDRTGYINGALDKLSNISTFKYYPNQTAAGFGFSTSEQHIGLSAQEIQAVYPEVVKLAPFDAEEVNGKRVSKSGENYLTVQYERLVPVLIEAIKEIKQDLLKKDEQIKYLMSQLEK